MQLYQGWVTHGSFPPGLFKFTLSRNQLLQFSLWTVWQYIIVWTNVDGQIERQADWLFDINYPKFFIGGLCGAHVMLSCFWTKWSQTVFYDLDLLQSHSISVELRIVGGAECIIVGRSALLCRELLYREFRLAWPRPCGIYCMLKSFVVTQEQGHLQILRPAVLSFLQQCTDLTKDL